MDSTATAIAAQACKLSPLARLELVDAILGSLDESDQQVDRQWGQEVEERLVAYRRGEMKAVPLEDILAKYR
ncbi:MAG: addiction module protein [Magnetococcales bacterium]|nr:addiction module protein [Magnetococcales bacterium]NGZ27829.1 addiction module protein [Magnetococcales bacterium]